MKRAKDVRRVLHLRAFIPKNSIAAVRAVWILAILWYDVGTFHWSLARCRWPDAELVYRDKKITTTSTSTPSPTHVLLIADPQVRAPHKNPAWRRRLHLTDLSLRKRWSFVRRVRPDVVVFLGDMLDDGRYARDDEEYRESVEYFKSVFSVDPSTTIYYVPGNHDIGLGPSSRMSTVHARRRYSKYFGPPNDKVSIANHTLMMLDAPGLVDEDYRRAASGKSFEEWQAISNGTLDFINTFAGVGSEEPVVLFSHIPMFRPDTATCGPLREKGTIRRGVGPGFQNMLMRDSTNYILRYVRPAVVFSGNDHDFCEYTHSIPLLSEGPEPKLEYVREVTVKAISSAGYIRRTGFHLLSLSPSSPRGVESKSFADAACFLPDEEGIYLSRYLPLFVFSLAVLLVSALRRSRTRLRHSDNFGLQYEQEDNLIPDANDVLSLSAGSDMQPEISNYLNPESTSFFNTARITGASGLGPTYRATANVPYTPHTPDFTVGGGTPSGFRSPEFPPTSPTNTTAYPPYLHAPTDEDETEGDEEEFTIPAQSNRYRNTSRFVKNDDYFRLTLDRARRRRQLSWTWTFEVGGRKRRLIVGVPYLLEHVCRTLWRAITGQSRGLRGNKTIQESVLASFLASFLATSWPPIFLYCIVYLIFLR